MRQAPRRDVTAANRPATGVSEPDTKVRGVGSRGRFEGKHCRELALEQDFSMAPEPPGDAKPPRTAGAGLSGQALRTCLKTRTLRPVGPFQAFGHTLQGLKKPDVVPPSFLPGLRKSPKGLQRAFSSRLSEPDQKSGATVRGGASPDSSPGSARESNVQRRRDRWKIANSPAAGGPGDFRGRRLAARRFPRACEASRLADRLPALDPCPSRLRTPVLRGAGPGPVLQSGPRGPVRSRLGRRRRGAPIWPSLPTDPIWSRS